MSGVSKIAAERNQKVLLDLLTKPGNTVCADCKARNPRWASHNLCIFICVSCASIHRKMGTHISKVKSVTLDSWTKEQVESMKAMGNLKSNAIYNPNETRYPPPPALADPENDAELESYIRSKYQYKKFIDKVALLTLKRSPTRSDTTAPRSASNPIVNQKASTPPPIPSSPSVPSVTNEPAQRSLPQRPSTVAPSSARSVSQPQLQPQQQKGGVWADLISLNETPRTSSLPLQYQMAPTPTGVGLSVNAPGNAFTPSVQMTSPMVPTSYHTTFFPPPLPTAGSVSNAFISSPPLSMVHTGFVTPQAQQQFLQPQPMLTGLPLTGMSQSLAQHPQLATPSPVIFSAPSPVIGPNLSSTTPQHPVPSPGIGYTQTQTTVTVSQPGIMITGAPQMQMTMPIQPGMTTGYMPSTTGMYQAQTGFGNMGYQQWGPL